MKRCVILFVRNPELGKVKTRIAATEGDEAALAIYKRLLQHTHEIMEKVAADKAVFYAGSINVADQWNASGYAQYLQSTEDLGHRMERAFRKIFANGYTEVCIIGSDCYELTAGIIEQAFEQLGSSDVVLGPAKDGGYYLLGMKQSVKPLFDGIEWSTESVLKETIARINNQNLTYNLLPTLSDVDTIDDVPEAWKAAIKSSKLRSI